MKGKLGGLLAESKQKLADSKQKLADSKLLQVQWSNALVWVTSGCLHLLLLKASCVDMQSLGRLFALVAVRP